MSIARNGTSETFDSLLGRTGSVIGTCSGTSSKPARNETEVKGVVES